MMRWTLHGVPSMGVLSFDDLRGQRGNVVTADTQSQGYASCPQAMSSIGPRQGRASARREALGGGGQGGSGTPMDGTAPSRQSPTTRGGAPAAKAQSNGTENPDLARAKHGGGSAVSGCVGLDNIWGEGRLVCLPHNLRKIRRYGRVLITAAAV